MKYYVSYVLNRKNGKRHRYNHQFGHSNNLSAYETLLEAKMDIESEYKGIYTSETANKVKEWYIFDSKCDLVLFGKVYETVKGNKDIEWYWI